MQGLVLGGVEQVEVEGGDDSIKLWSNKGEIAL